MTRLLCLVLLLCLAAGADEATDRARDRGEAQQMLAAGQFKELDKLATERRTQKYPSGRSRLHQYYQGLKGITKEQLQAWLDVNDDSFPARILSGQEVEKCPDPYYLFRQLEAGKDVMDKVIALDRTYLEAYQERARHLKGKALLEFADKATASYGKLGEGMFAVVYCAGNGLPQEDFPRERTVEAFRALLKHYEGNLYWLSLYTKTAAFWDDKVMARELGLRLGDHCDPEVWTQKQWDRFQAFLKAEN